MMSDKTLADALREAVIEGPKVYYPLDNYGHVASAIPVSWLSERAEQLEGAEFEPSDAQELLEEADALIDSWDQKGSWSADSPVGMVMRLAAALRRSEASEPQGEPLMDIAKRIGASERSSSDFNVATSRPLGPEPQGEPSDDYEAGYAEGFHHGVSSPRGSAESDREQGEPSDAEVLAAMNTYHDDQEAVLRDWSPYKVNAMRAALRAAANARRSVASDAEV
jgi:hypothetical protein